MDAAALRRSLELAIGIASVSVACTRNEGGEGNVDPKPVATETTQHATKKPLEKDPPPVPTEAPTVGLPTGGGGCEPVAWCGKASAVAKLATMGSKTDLGCPTALEDDGTGKKPAAMPWFGFGTLQVAETKAHRAKSGAADDCCYSLQRLCGGGRPFADGDVARVAALRSGDAWSIENAGALAVDEPHRAALGEAWLEDARIEHASVASFARASLELMALGAPPDLVADCHRAALDEVRHARLCFAIASRLLGRDVEPGTMTMPSPRASGLADVARATVIEGCFGETVAALIAARSAEGCDDAALRSVLDAIARDEADHAALAFRVVAWCVARGGAPVRDAVLDAATHAPSAANSGSTWAPGLGRLDDDALAAAHRDAIEGVVLPILRALADR